MHTSDILSLSTRESNSTLLLGALRDYTPCKCEDIAQGGLAVVDVATPISVHIPKQ